MSKPTSDERWLPIPGFSAYQVSDHGRVWSSKRGRGQVLKAFPARDGYPQVQIVSDDGRLVNRKLHVLVLEVFVGPRPMGLEACHDDGDHTNPRLSNLRWATRSDNNQDRRRHGVALGKVANASGKTHLELSSGRREACRRAFR